MMAELPPGLPYLISATLAAFVGMYHLALYRPRRELLEHFWLGPLGITTACYILTRSPYSWLFAGSDPIRLRQFECIFMFATTALFFQVIMPFVPKRIKQLLFYYQLVQVALIPVVVVLPGLALDPQFMLWWQLASLPFALAIFFVVTRQARF